MADEPRPHALQESQCTRRVARFGPYEADFDLKLLRRDGVKIRIQEQPFRLLKILIDRGGGIVTREELRKSLWPADVFVKFDPGLNTALNKLRYALRDDPDRPIFIETLPRNGYRFVAPINWVELPHSTDPSPNPVTPTAVASELPRHQSATFFPIAFTWRRTAASLLALTALAIGAVMWKGGGQSQNAAPKRDKIVVLVLPFDNLSVNQSENYLSDGFTEEVITQLEGRYARCLRVLAKSSAAQLKASHMPFDRMARELGVHYVVAGCIRRSNDRIRVTAQLIHASDQMSIWANTYDEQEQGDLIAMESEVSSRIAESLALEIVPYAKFSDGLNFGWQNALAHDSETRDLQLDLTRSPFSLGPASNLP
jgi:TolB-like protein/DNA-binding winged helix-turn-helix (wHTH) protein